MSIKDDLKELCETMTGEKSNGNTINAVLKDVCKNLTGKDSAGKTISETIKDIDTNYPDKLTVDVNVGASVDLLGKTINDLQEKVYIEDNKIYGKLKYVTGYTGFSGDVSEQSGNYLVLHCTANNSSAITVEVKNGTHGPSTLDDDGIIICRIANKATQSIEVKNGDKTINLSLAELVVEPAPAE